MRPVSVFPDYLVKLVIPPSRAITKPAVICRCVPLVLSTFDFPDTGIWDSTQIELCGELHRTGLRLRTHLTSERPKTWGPLAVKTRRRRMEDASRIRSKHMIRMMVIKARLAGETIRCVALVGVRWWADWFRKLTEINYFKQMPRMQERPIRENRLSKSHPGLKLKQMVCACSCLWFNVYVCVCVRECVSVCL